MLLVDDLGWKDVGFNGSRFYETPNIDRLAAKSMIFTSAYAACAVSSPTRASGKVYIYEGGIKHKKLIDHVEG
jgi:arylsulfatase A-like enzyme